MLAEIKIALWISLAILILTGFYAFQYQSNVQKFNLGLPSSGVPSSSVAPGASGASLPGASVSLTLEYVAKHSGASDCWMIVSGNVYDVTGYLNAHPGGRQSILQFCGKDGTSAFLTKGGQGSHSQYADQLLSSFFVGKLNTSISQQNLQNTQTNIQKTQQNLGGSKKGGREDD